MKALFRILAIIILTIIGAFALTVLSMESGTGIRIGSGIVIAVVVFIILRIWGK